MSDWTAKLHANPEPEVRPMPKDRIGLHKGDLCLLPSARLVDDFIRAIPKGKAVSLLDMRATLARRHKAAGTPARCISAITCARWPRPPARRAVAACRCAPSRRCGACWTRTR
jgi:hypothetical protein